MKKIYSLLLLTVLLLCSCDKNEDLLIHTLDLTGLPNTPESEFTGVYNGKDANTEPYSKNTFSDKSGYFIFDNYTSSYKTFGGGFTYTNKTDIKTSGYANNSAITKGGVKSANYLTASTNIYTPAAFCFVSNMNYNIKGMYVTNSTYAYLSIKDGDNYARKFVANDWFKLTAIGLDSTGKETGRADFYLADYRDGKSVLVDKWTWFDLSALGKVAKVKFEMSSTDNGQYGMNTPAYFCIDGITISE